MIKQIIVLLAVAITSTVHVKSNAEDHSFAENYLEYYRSIALAEEAVVSGHYVEAIECYRETFNTYAFSNPIDCYVAAQVAAYTKDSAACLSFMFRGLSFGLPIQTVSQNPHLAETFKSTSKHKVDSCWSKYRSRIDTHARATIIAIAQRDANFLRDLDLPSGGLYGPDGYTLKDIYRPFYDSLIAEIIQLTRTSGYPAHRIVGTQNGEDSLYRIGPNSVFAVISFIHHGNAWGRVDTLLWAELLKGNITPQAYGVIYETGNRIRPYGSPVRYFASSYCQEWRCKFMTLPVQRKKLNRKRWDIGLGSYEVMKKKFKSSANYRRWSGNKTKNKGPFFDFECNVGFHGRK